MIIIDAEEDIQKLNLSRLQTIKKVKVTSGCVEHGWAQGVRGMTKLLKSVDQITSVRKIHGLDLCNGISAVEPNLVVRVINRLEVLLLGGCGISLTPGQLTLLFSDMARNTNVKFLVVGGDFSEIIPEVFGAAISNVKDVRLFGVDYTTSHQHMKALFSAIMVGDKQLKRLAVRVAMDTAHSIDTEMIGRAINMLEHVHGNFDSEQAAAILRNLVEGETRLKKLWLSGDISGVDKDIIRRAGEKVELIF